MLEKKDRITNDKEIKKVLRTGRKLFTHCLVIRWKKNYSNEIRFAFVVSTKVSKKAVVRNKIRRVLRSGAKRELKNLQRGNDIVIIARKNIKELSSSEIINELTSALGGAKMYRN